MNQYISLNDVCVSFDIHNASSRSIRNSILSKSTGGIITDKPHERITTVEALRNLNFRINHGDRIGIIGHNGAGKTTLLRVLSGIYYPTHGSININGTVSPLIDLTLGIDQECSGYDNINLRAAILRIPEKDLDKYFKDVISFANLGDFIHLPFRTYSAGMRLRLAFATSAMFNPDILVMDEWISAGDADFKKQVSNHLLSLINKSNIFIIASHSMDIIKKTCNRVLWFKKGQLFMDGETSFVLKEFLSKTK